MECGVLPRSLIQILSEVLYTDADGNIFLNTTNLRVDCNAITPVIDCDTNMPINEGFVAENLKSTDDCGNTALKLGHVVTEEDPIILENAVWDDLRAPANGINPIGSPSPATPNTADGSLTFSKGNVAVAWFQLPHHWKEGTNLHIHIHWSKSTTNNGTVHWQMKYKWANIGDVMPAFSSLANGAEEIPNSNTVDKHAMFEWNELDGTGKTISSMLCVFLQRTNDGSDTFTGNANLYEMDIHYQIDSLGSTGEYIK